MHVCFGVGVGEGIVGVSVEEGASYLSVCVERERVSGVCVERERASVECVWRERESVS